MRISRYCGLLAFWPLLVFGINDQQLQSPATEIRLQIVNGCQLNGQLAGADLGTLNFGRIFDLAAPVAQVTASGSGSLRLRCTPGTSARVLLNAGTHGANVNNRRMRHAASGSTLGYQLYTSAAHTNVWDDLTGMDFLFLNDSERLIPIYGLIPAQATPAAGIYSDLVTVTVQY
ncbi:MAG: spore coat U domain-containing protein [Cellvibrionaceae bacterium]|nr:spore coat U domain-containing protein [Cellvibrionaceae bacterium]